MTVYETDIPGVGRKFEMDIGGGERVVVVVHHDRRCEVFRRPDPDADSEKLLDLSSDQANKLGSILEGAYFESVDVGSLTVPLGDAIIEWWEVEDGSSFAGRTLAEMNVRAETGVSVIAVQRGDETIANPDPEFEVADGDLLVTVGTRAEQNALEELLG
ncbi:cation:proton antiporter regulatory subunit [Halobacterium litoreum]|uniref:Cation:proton antiporter regulatory subunit n=1 Tax=Halobacterium litoreum TaxID=2039234 RepID=A0ABD5NIG3_9EURY|nr:TrkA C-terminal domain-containing protein [Halobacterium litoreum]UHH12387.1 potassium transporter TrkA [Halobacterium litoreum]